MLEVAEALALSFPEILKSSVLIDKGDEELAVELPPKTLKSISETLTPPRDWLREPKKSRSRSTRRRFPLPVIVPL
jgi:hypothetical protein